MTFPIDLSHPAVHVAPLLLGWRLVRTLDGQTLAGIIVETEAYDERDAASHSFKGKTPRTQIMFGASGRAYVYFTYGMHYCMNIVTGSEGEGSAVLVRALEPTQGIEIMERLRHGVTQEQLTNGPAKLCQALAVDKTFNGHDLATQPLQLLPPETSYRPEVIATTRIGITKDTHRLWRFYDASKHVYVSHLATQS